jgi:hypothetical protein
MFPGIGNITTNIPTGKPLNKKEDDFKNHKTNKRFV